MLTTALDLLGVALLMAFAWFVWEPLPILVLAVALLLASRARSRTPDPFTTPPGEDDA